MLFPNSIKDKNNKFYYSVIDINHGYDFIDKVITLTEGAYKFNHINAIIEQKIPNESIKLVVDQASSRCKILLKQGY